MVFPVAILAVAKTLALLGCHMDEGLIVLIGKEVNIFIDKVM
jgi:hypothetical protein